MFATRGPAVTVPLAKPHRLLNRSPAPRSAPRRPGSRSGGTASSREHRAARGRRRGEREKSSRLDHIVVDGFHAAAHEVRFVPEAGPARVSEKLAPPFAMRVGPRPSLQRIEVAPVLAHAGVRWKHRKQKILVKQQAIRPCLDGIRNPGTKAEYSFQPVHAVDAHPEIDDDEIRIPREIYRASIDPTRHEAPPPPLPSASSRHRCAIAQGRRANVHTLPTTDLRAPDRWRGTIAGSQRSHRPGVRSRRGAWSSQRPRSASRAAAPDRLL